MKFQNTIAGWIFEILRSEKSHYNTIYSTIFLNFSLSISYRLYVHDFYRLLACINA